MALADGKSTIEVSGIALEMDVRGNGKPLLTGWHSAPVAAAAFCGLIS